MTTTDRPRRKCAHYGSWHGYKETNYENERDTDAMGVKVDVGGREERGVAGSALASAGTSSVDKNSDEDRVLSLPPPTTTAAP